MVTAGRYGNSEIHNMLSWHNFHLRAHEITCHKSLVDIIAFIPFQDLCLPQIMPCSSEKTIGCPSINNKDNS